MLGFFTSMLVYRRINNTNQHNIDINSTSWFLAKLARKVAGAQVHLGRIFSISHPKTYRTKIFRQKWEDPKIHQHWSISILRKQILLKGSSRVWWGYNIYLYIYSYIHIFIYSYIHIFIYSYIHIFIYIYISIYSYIYIYLCVCVGGCACLLFHHFQAPDAIFSL